jgi:hypothetical protein
MKTKQENKTMSDFELPVKEVVPAPEEVTDIKVTPEPPEFTPEELAKIFDEIIFAESYREDVVIRDKLRVTFRTRTVEETEQITSELDTNPVNLLSTLREKQSLLNLCHSLVSYQGKDLSSVKIEEKKKFVMKLAAPVVSMLSVALNKFDRKVFLACKDGEENF